MVKKIMKQKALRIIEKIQPLDKVVMVIFTLYIYSRVRL